MSGNEWGSVCGVARGHPSRPRRGAPYLSPLQAATPPRKKTDAEGESAPSGSASESALDELVLQHLRTRGFAQSASALEREIRSKSGASPATTSADGERPALSKLLISSAAPMYAQDCELERPVDTAPLPRCPAPG
eukprot:3839723-Prymnesium_polylepis.1